MNEVQVSHVGIVVDHAEIRVSAPEAGGIAFAQGVECRPAAVAGVLPSVGGQLAHLARAIIANMQIEAVAEHGESGVGGVGRMACVAEAVVNLLNGVLLLVGVNRSLVEGFRLARAGIGHVFLAALLVGHERRAFDKRGGRRQVVSRDVLLADGLGAVPVGLLEQSLHSCQHVERTTADAALGIVHRAYGFHEQLTYLGCLQVGEITAQQGDNGGHDGGRQRRTLRQVVLVARENRGYQRAGSKEVDGLSAVVRHLGTPSLLVAGSYTEEIGQEPAGTVNARRIARNGIEVTTVVAGGTDNQHVAVGSVADGIVHHALLRRVVFAQADIDDAGSVVDGVAYGRSDVLVVLVAVGTGADNH